MPVCLCSGHNVSLNIIPTSLIAPARNVLATCSVLRCSSPGCCIIYSNILSTNKGSCFSSDFGSMCERICYLCFESIFYISLFCFQIHLGSNQYLFSVVVDPREMPCFCLRHDVDALLWQPHSDQPENMWEHIATFNALGGKLTPLRLFCLNTFSMASIDSSNLN